MGVVGSSGITQVSGTVETEISTPLPNSLQTLICVIDTGTGANANTYTVPANKIFYIFGFSLNATATVSGKLKNNAGTEIANIRGVNDENPILSSSVPLAKYTAAQNVITNCTAASAVTIWGVLVDA